MPQAAGVAEQTVGQVHLFAIGLFEEIEHDTSGMLAEPAVGFPLRLVVELVPGALVRERPIAHAILQHVGRLIPRQRRFEEKDRPLVHAPWAVVMDRAHDGVLACQAVVARPERADVQFDLDAEIFAHAAKNVGQVVKGHFRIRPAIGDNDVAAVAADEFVKAEVFEVVAVGEVQVLLVRARPAQQFVEKEPPRKQIVAAVTVARMRHPEAEAQIQGAHQKRHRWSEIDGDAAHLRIERCGRCRQSGGEPQVVQFGGLIAQADAIDGQNGAAGAAVERAQAIPGHVIGRNTQQVQRERLTPGDLLREGVFEE